MYPLPLLPCSLPTRPIPDFIDLNALAQHFSTVLTNLKEDNFLSDAIHKPSSFAARGIPRLMRMGKVAYVEIQFAFETNGTPKTAGSGFLSLVPDEDGSWKIWVLRTVLESLSGQPDVDELRPLAEESESIHVVEANVNGTEEFTNGNGHVSSGINGVDGANNSYEDVSNDIHSNITNDDTAEHFDCVVVGGGQAGLSAGGRLKALGITYVVIDKFPEVGDSWKTRYDSTKLHTIREFAHLPFDRTFPATSYGEFLTKNELAQGYRAWVQKYGINVWQSSTVVKGSWDAQRQLWTIKVQRHGKEMILTSSFLIFAPGGGSQVPVTPSYENRESFKGITIHSGEYRNAKDWAGKHGVVVGTVNTGHDVAEHMVDAGMASITMIQRSSTRKARADPRPFEDLEKAGFKVDHDGDLTYNLFIRFGGHYMDVGASAKIAKGLIKVKSDSLPVRYLEDGLECSNGDHIKADVIVFATGFVGNLKILASEMFGSDVASQIDDFFGLDEEGELKGAFKPMGHPAFWYHGGAVAQARYCSRFIALQIKAKLIGTPLPVYLDTPGKTKTLHT
ncbi:hypothetical protein DL95DRAFT_428905 [Leptodontidium sp. 2 PMI_412]|nr:hypothetical protein DL95DRAFT_428905 [Leptodontidium sp. 2 PMI_412]